MLLGLRGSTSTDDMFDQTHLGMICLNIKDSLGCVKQSSIDVDPLIYKYPDY